MHPPRSFPRPIPFLILALLLPGSALACPAPSDAYLFACFFGPVLAVGAVALFLTGWMILATIRGLAATVGPVIDRRPLEFTPVPCGPTDPEVSGIHFLP